MEDWADANRSIKAGLALPRCSIRSNVFAAGYAASNAPALTSTSNKQNNQSPFCTLSNAPVSALNTAPIAVAIAPDSPAALPARSGGTLIVPVLAAARLMPLAAPKVTIKPNTQYALSQPKSTSANAATGPIIPTQRPQIIIDPSDMRSAMRAVMKLPMKYQTAVAPIFFGQINP